MKQSFMMKLPLLIDTEQLIVVELKSYRAGNKQVTLSPDTIGMVLYGGYAKKSSIFRLY
jgi:hypothetical protein